MLDQNSLFCQRGQKLFEDKLQTIKQISSTKNLECLQAQLLQHLRALVRRPHAALPQLF